MDLSIDYASSLQLRVRGSLTGTGSYTYDPDFNASTINDVTITNVMLTFGDVRLSGTAEFALVKRSVTADVDGTGNGLLFNGVLTSLALTVSGLGVHVEDLAHISVSGQLALATLKSAAIPLVDGRSWTALKMGNVVVAGNVNLGLDGVTAQITVDALDLNLGETVRIRRRRRRGWIGRVRSIWMAMASMTTCWIRAPSCRRRWICRSTSCRARICISSAALRLPSVTT